MAGKIPVQSGSRLPTFAYSKLPSTTSKRRLSEENISSPEKKSRFENASNGQRLESQDKVSKYLVNRPKAVPAGRLRRSVSMASIVTTKRPTNTLKKTGFQSNAGGSTLNLARRGTNVTSSTLNLAKRGTNVTSSTTKFNLANRDTRNNPSSGLSNGNVLRPSNKRNIEPSVNEPVKGKSKRSAWDLKGRLQDMEEILKKNSNKMSDYDTRMALLEKEKNTLSQNLEETKSYSASAQEEINNLSNMLSKSQDENSILQDRIHEVEMKKCSLEKREKCLEAELSLKMDELISLKATVNHLTTLKESLEQEVTSIKSLLESKLDLIKKLEYDKECQDNLNKDLKQKLVEGESERRKLHNLVLELKGNIRVFCRVRPLIEEEIAKQAGIDVIPHINFVDERSVELTKFPNLDCSSGGLKNKNNNFEFIYDRVFSPSDSQLVVFEEVAQLVQSALDGYNVCIFAYGQTGSGKTFTMEGVYDDDQFEGMIPRAVKHVFHSLEDLKEKGWFYKIEASFLEIYNECIRDLLANPKTAKNLNYDIKFNDGKKQDIHVTNLKIIPVENASQVHNLLSVAQKHRAVATTNMNERSSRSHSVFQLRLKGRNQKTDEACEGSLNLVDLAGSERLKDSGSEGARLTETQNINKSLANLGNVIMALGQKQSHIPYRNSKLTHLLQNSLGGNSKTLMFVNVSPLESSFNETLNSLRFATKVNQCHIGTAVKQVKK